MGSLSLGFSPVVLGHTDELWALAAHPSLPQFLTAGFDNIVQLWDAMSHTVVWSKDIAVGTCFATFTRFFFSSPKFMEFSAHFSDYFFLSLGTSAVRNIFRGWWYPDYRLCFRKMVGHGF